MSATRAGPNPSTSCACIPVPGLCIFKPSAISCWSPRSSTSSRTLPRRNGATPIARPACGCTTSRTPPTRGPSGSCRSKDWDCIACGGWGRAMPTRPPSSTGLPTTYSSASTLRIPRGREKWAAGGCRECGRRAVRPTTSPAGWRFTIRSSPTAWRTALGGMPASSSWMSAIPVRRASWDSAIYARRSAARRIPPCRCRGETC